MAAYALGRHFANSMRVPMQDCNELLLRCSPFSPEVPDSHPGRLHAAVRVVDNAWRDDGGLEMLQVLVDEMEAAGVQPAYTQRLSPEGHPRGDPSDSTSSAVAQRVGAAVLMEEMEAAGVQPTYTQRLSPEGHPRGDPSDSTSSAVAQGVGAAVLMARDPSGDESVTPTTSSLAQGRGPPAGAQRVDCPGEVFSPPAPRPPSAATDSAACVGHGTLDPGSQVCPADESPSIASIMDPTRVLTPHSPAPHPACLTLAASDGGVASSLKESPIPLAQKSKEPAAVDCIPSSTGTVAAVKACGQSSAESGYTPVEHPSSLATVRACSQSSADSGTTPVEHPSSLEQSPRSKKHPGVTPPSNGAAMKRGKKEQGRKAAPIDPDAMALDDVDKQPNKAEVGRVLPTARSLKLRILPDQYVAGACFYYAVAQSLHAMSSNTPLDGASLRAKANAVFRDMCGLSIEESALSVNRDLEKDTWRGRPQGGKPDHFVALAKHVDGSVVLLRSNRFSIVTSGFGIDSALTSAAVWVPGREDLLHFHD